MQTEHTSEPWETIDGAEIWPTTGDNAQIELCRVVGPWEDSTYYGKREAAANGRRIVSCVNGCTGLNPKGIPELLVACKAAQDLTDKWKRTKDGADFHHVDNLLRSALDSVTNTEGGE